MSVFSNEQIEQKNETKTIQTPDPIVIGPLRLFSPYEFTFKTTAKGRWYNRVLLDVFDEEFKYVSRETLIERIENGKITVNGAKINKDYIIKAHDSISHTSPRFDSPAYNISVTVIGETDDFIAFFKPPSLPIHATGGYFYNCLSKQIKGSYLPVHRLDRVTSGIVVMAKNESAANHFTNMLRDGSISKTYVARVTGVFPDGETVVEEPIIECKGIRAKRTCGPNGKESKTVFRRLSTNGRESIVECHPITGRTHQIRVHLAHLGFPISNDALYGGKESALTKEEQEALSEAEKRGLLATEVLEEWHKNELTFQIYLCSIHYKSTVFDFNAEMPSWATL